MANVIRFVACLFLAAALSACSPAEPVAVLQPDPAQEIRLSSLIAETAVPAVVAVQEVVEQIAPDIEPVADPDAEFIACATKAIVRWEITSPKVYTKRYQGVICPGGASGPTRGVGWDDGHQTQRMISDAWFMHPQLERILPASGQTGEAKCRTYRSGARDVVTPYEMAEQVFSLSSLPAYKASARRAMGAKVFDALSPCAQAAWVATVYNRGAQMVGPRRTEMRVIADDCAPRKDYACMGTQYRSMCRLWSGSIGPGLCARYEDMARIVEQEI